MRHRDCVMNVNCSLDDDKSQWSPIVAVSWSPDGQVDVELFTGKSFVIREEAKEAGMKMGIKWIDSWKDL
jgi:hypothetical protein